MKIAFLNIYYGVVPRRAENFVKEISARLEKEHTVDIYSQQGQITEETARQQTSFNLLGKMRYKLYLDSHSLRVLIFTLSIIQKILRERYDWVVSVDAGWQLLILKLLKFIGLGKYKILISGQAGIGRDDLRNLRIGPDAFVALTRRAEDWAKSVNPGVPVFYIPNGVDLRHFTANAKPASLDLEKPIVICVAGMNPYKRVDLSIRAVAKMGKGSLLVLGDGPQKEEIEVMGNELLGARGFLRITTEYEKMPSYYAAADLFTLVSASSEAFGSAYVEAMACGLPVVATDDENRHEIIGNAGVFVNPENTDEYAEALKEALKKDWKNQPRAQAEKFSWDEVTRKYQEIFESLL